MFIQELTNESIHHFSDAEDFCKLLNQLSPTSLKFHEFYDILLNRIRNDIHTFVAWIDGNMVGTASIKYEQKFSYSGSWTGQIEDVVVDDKYRGKGIAKALVKFLCKEAEKRVCRKVLLNCKDELIPFYEKCGFQKVGNEMRLDFA